MSPAKTPQSTETTICQPSDLPTASFEDPQIFTGQKKVGLSTRFPESC
jgi:hypothetical protein